MSKNLVSVIYENGRYEVMLFKRDGRQSNPVWVYSWENVKQQVDKWQQRYNASVEINSQMPREDAS